MDAPGKLRCSQCGATAFDELADHQVRCQYCQTLYQRRAPQTGAAVNIHIGKNVKLFIGEHANIEVHARVNMEIEEGAEIHMDGHLTVIEPPDPQVLELAKARLARGE